MGSWTTVFSLMLCKKKTDKELTCVCVNMLLKANVTFLDILKMIDGIPLKTGFTLKAEEAPWLFEKLKNGQEASFTNMERLLSITKEGDDSKINLKKEDGTKQEIVLTKDSVKALLEHEKSILKVMKDEEE